MRDKLAQERGGNEETGSVINLGCNVVACSWSDSRGAAAEEGPADRVFINRLFFDFRSEAFRQGLRDLGYIEGQNVTVESRWADGRDDRVTELAAELVYLKVDVIVAAGGTQTAVATKNATRTVPIVFATVGDPVGAGLIASFARPGGNVTGLSNDAPELGGKRLELLKEAILRISRVSVLTNPANPSHGTYLKETEVAAQALGLQTQALGVRGPDDFDNAFLSMTKWRAGALIVLADAMFTTQRRRLAELAIKGHLPVMFSGSQYVEAGGLMSYGPTSLFCIGALRLMWTRF